MSSVNTSSQTLNYLDSYDFDEAVSLLETLREERAKNSENNLEYDLRSAEWMCSKVKASEEYAQSLYAALCNVEYQKLETMRILKEETWSCSWRYAGGVVAKMREQGSYMDWYCSSFGREHDTVSEGTVTQEIRDDLKKIGWMPFGDANVNF